MAGGKNCEQRCEAQLHGEGGRDGGTGVAETFGESEAHE